LSSAPNKSDGFLPRIEAMRGVAALIVAVFHIGFLLNISEKSIRDVAYAAGGMEALAYRIYMGLANGYGCVDAFFVMSGFVLAKSLDRMTDQDPFWRQRYFTTRVFRLFPAAIFSVGLFTILYYQFGLNTYSSPFNTLNVVLNMLMIRVNINLVMWSMQVECIGTFLILAAVLMVKRHGAKPAIWLIGVLFILSFIGQFSDILPDTNLSMLYAFVVGVLLHFYGKDLAAKVSANMAMVLAVLAIIVFFLCGGRGATGWTLLLQCLCPACLVVFAVWKPELSIFKPLDTHVARFYGRISYSFYLLHPLTLRLTNHVMEPVKALHADGLPYVGITIIAAIFSILLITPFAYLSWRYIELPGIALGRYVLAAWKMGSPAKAPASV
jgi:peptidoglycan/LPS O-acetylase OafA/YrhL